MTAGEELVVVVEYGLSIVALISDRYWIEASGFKLV